MEDVEMITEKNSNMDQDADPTFLMAYDEEKKENIIQISISNNQLILEIISKNNDNNSYYNNYISRNFLDRLKQNNKIFSTYQSLLDIKNVLKQFTSNNDIKFIQDDNKYILTIPTSSEIQNEIKFDLEEKSKIKLKERFAKLLNDKKKLEEEKQKIQKQKDELENKLKETKEEIEEKKIEILKVKEDMNLFLGEGSYYIVSGLSQNKCLDVTHTGKLMINDFYRNNSQKFLISTENGLEHYIYSSKDKNKILDIDIERNEKVNNGAKLKITENIHYGNSQRWLIAQRGDYFYIKSCAHENKIIDVPFHDTKNGTLINLWWYNGNDNQLWKFIKAE